MHDAAHPMLLVLLPLKDVTEEVLIDHVLKQSRADSVAASLLKNVIHPCVICIHARAVTLTAHGPLRIIGNIDVLDYPVEVALINADIFDVDVGVERVHGLAMLSRDGGAGTATK